MIDLKNILEINRKYSGANRPNENQTPAYDMLRGVFSICSAHPVVLRAGIQYGKENNLPILIETTCNQVNQNGGYTRLNPAEFIAELKSWIAEYDLEPDQVIAGGDHLGPYPWKHLSAVDALKRGCELVADYVQAGYTKIHLDASMNCADDDLPLSPETIAERTASLCLSAETVYARMAENRNAPLYVIGTEVPPPGGMTEAEDEVWVTSPENAAETYELTRKAFFQIGLHQAWERVIALVAQPGVDFGNQSISHYNPSNSLALHNWIETTSSLVFEAHSTDYQSRSTLKNLVKDHFAILKVGPALTFAYRQAIFSLAAIEEELFSGDSQPISYIRQVLERVMLQDPSNWQQYYHGKAEEIRLALKYSLSDRCRYYWHHLDVKRSLSVLEHNLSKRTIPTGLFYQHFPDQFFASQREFYTPSPKRLVTERIQNVLADYTWACLNTGVRDSDE